MSSLPTPSAKSSGRDTARLKVAATQPQVDLRLGAWVVYGSHGLGRVSGADGGCAEDESFSGSVVLEFESNGLSVTLPRERAVVCLRSVAGTSELAAVRDALRRPDTSIETSWQARTKCTRAKLAAGEAAGLAEIVRDGFERDRASSSGGLSMHERELYLKARRLLAAELGAATSTDEAEADAWIEGQLEASTVGCGELVPG